jgi:hypothetical protein
MAKFMKFDDILLLFPLLILSPTIQRYIFAVSSSDQVFLATQIPLRHSLYPLFNVKISMLLKNHTDVGKSESISGMSFLPDHTSSDI